MFCAIINQLTDEVVETREVAERSEMRPRLIELREADEDAKYGMSDGETLEAAIDSAKTQAAKNRTDWAAKAEFMASLPVVSGPGELSKEQWENAMSKLGTHNRYQAANLAAHSWAVIEHEDGLILVGHAKGDYALLLSGDQEIKVDVPRICHTCKFSRTHIATREEYRRGIMPCNITGKSTYLRRVHRTDVCSGWKS
jgi:hypothetical protein